MNQQYDDHLIYLQTKTLLIINMHNLKTKSIYDNGTYGCLFSAWFINKMNFIFTFINK